MVEYRTSAHAIWDVKYHVVWIRKYRYKVLCGEVAERARDLIRQICAAREVTIVRGAVSPDHIHSSAGGGTAATGTRQAGAVFEGPVEPDVAGGVSAPAQAVLRAAFVGARIFLRDGGRGG